MTHVLLLRAPSGTDDKDPYEAQFASDGLTATSVPVYETVFSDLHELQWIVETGAGFHGYKGVVITSGRAVEAWAKAAQAVLETELPAQSKPNWETIPFYVVGEATAAALKNLAASLPSYLLPSEVLGAESGTSEKLAHLILEHCEQTQDVAKIKKKRKAKLLYLTGDKNRDTLAKILVDGNIELDSVQVYKTHNSPTFEASLRGVLEAESNVNDWWITFFAPSGADFSLPILQKYFLLPGSSKSNQKKGLPTVKIAAIGPTTAAHLREQLSIEVAAVAEKPNAQSLASAIASLS